MRARGIVRNGWLAAILLGWPACAQERGPLYSGMSEFGAWAGYSLANPTLIGSITHRKLAVAGLRYGYVFANKGDVAIEYTIDLVPAAVVFLPSGERLVKETGDQRLANRGRSAVYGGGVSPIGFKFNFARRRGWQPFFAAATGFVYSTNPVPVPVPEGTAFNFTINIGGGLQIFTAHGRALTLGYRLDHISNAGRSYNPGLDASVVYIGFSLFR